jgi:hypothetical protein
MKIKELVEAAPALAALNQCQMPAKTAYRVSRIIAKANAELKVYEDSRMQLFKQLGTHDEAQDTWTINPENIEQFNTEMTGIMEEEVNLDDCPSIALSTLEKVQITPAHISAMAPFLEET